MTKLIDYIKTKKVALLFYWFLKLILGLGFVLSGLRKMPSVKFTQIPISEPVGLFFEGMYATGFYWNFIGYYQILVGLLLMTKWFKSLTPVLLFPVSVNIFLVSISLQMTGTPVITGLMLFGNIFLLLWHSNSYQAMLKRDE